MLALNVVPLLMVIIMAMGGDDLAPGLEVLLSCCGGTWAGAFVASLRARSRGKRQVSVSPETGKGLDDREGSR
jgi:hypothetical protein